MLYSRIVGVISGKLIADSVGLKEGSQVARVAIIPGILGFNIVSLLIAKVVADQEAESLRPAIQVDPAEHDYGTVDVGSSATKIFVVGNTGTADLAVTEIALDGDNSDQFAIVSGGVTAGGNSSKVAPGATHKVEVSFKPTALWQKTARLDITSNDPARPAVKIELKGEVGVPAIRVEPPDNDYTPVKSRL